MGGIVNDEISVTFDDVFIVPQYSDIRSRSDIDTWSSVGEGIGLNVPLIATPMDTICEKEMAIALGQLGGMGTIHRFMSIDEQIAQVNETLNYVSNSHLAAAVGVGQSDRKRISRLCQETDIKVLNVDIAHGHHQLMKNTISAIRAGFPDIHIMAGTVCTPEAVKDLIEWGADSIQVGVGNGSLCTTRIKAGVGVPQFTALRDCVVTAHNSKVAIISNGGCKSPGDIAKAIAAGASAVVVGSLFAGTKETPGDIRKTGTWPNETLYKAYRGSASADSKSARGEKTNIEGTSQVVLYRGKVKRIVDDIMDGLRSSMSYTGSDTIAKFQHKAVFNRVSQAGLQEAQPHGLGRNSL